MIPLVKPFFAPAAELMPELEKIIYSGYVAEGERVYEFEKQFSNYIGNPYCLSLSSGTAALHIALLMAGVGAGDEVISTALTAEPTNVAIKFVGAKVVWADVDPTTGLLSPESIRAKITSRTKMILVVHYAGMVCDMDSIGQISKEMGIPVLEDAAHALGSQYCGHMVGCDSQYTVFSLQAIKHMTTIDGGFLALKSQEKFDNGRFKRWFGLDKSKPRLENDIKNVGFKYNMNNVNATVGLVQMRHVRDIVATHVDNGEFYDRELKGVAGVELVSYYKNTKPSYWLYTMKVERRDNFCRHLEANGIAASPLHLRNDRHSIFAESKCELPNLDNFYSKFVHIPCGWWVTNEERQHIVDVIKKGW